MRSRSRTSGEKSLSRTWLADDRGQALVIAVLSMFALLVIMSYMIDSSTWQAKRQQAQSAADAASLAATDCLQSSTCAANYAATATAIAVANGASASNVKVTTNAAGNQATVSVTNPTKAALNGLGGVSGPNQVAAAVSSETARSAAAAASCPTGLVGNSNCLAIFGGDTCSQASWSVYLDLGSTDFKGTLMSNGGFGVTSYQQWRSNSPIYYGAAANGCSGSNLLGGGSVTYDGTNGTSSGSVDTPRQLTANVAYPEYWAVPSGWSTWSGYNSTLVNETTPTCTYTPSNLPSAPSGMIIYASGNTITINGHGTIPTGTYCASGQINLQGGTLTGNVTLISSDVEINCTAVQISPCQSNGCSSTNQLLLMQTGTSEMEIDNSQDSLTGTIFTPAAESYIYLVPTVNGLLEGAQVWFCMGGTYNAGTYAGSGAQASTLISSSSSLTG